jgi:hypothetical protein
MFSAISNFITVNRALFAGRVAVGAAAGAVMQSSGA